MSSSSESGPSSPTENVININIKSLEQKQNISVRVPNNLPISEFKNQIKEKLDVPVDRQRIIFRGKVLQDNLRLSDYGLEDGQTVHLVAKRPAVESTNSSPSSQADQSQSNNTNNNNNTPTMNVGGNLNSILSSVFNAILPGGSGMQARQNAPPGGNVPARRIVIRRPANATGAAVSASRIAELLRQIRNTLEQNGQRIGELQELLQNNTYAEGDTQQIQNLARELAPLLNTLQSTSAEASEALGNLHLGNGASSSHGYRTNATSTPQPQQVQQQNNLPISGIQLHVHANSNELEELPNRLRPFINNLQQQNHTQTQHQPQLNTQQQTPNINLVGQHGEQAQTVPVGSASITIVSGDDNQSISDALRNVFQQQSQQTQQSRQQSQQPQSQSSAQQQQRQSQSDTTNQSQTEGFNLADLASSLLGASASDSGARQSATTPHQPTTQPSGRQRSASTPQQSPLVSLLSTFGRNLSVSQLADTFFNSDTVTDILLRCVLRFFTMDDVIAILSGNWSNIEKARDLLRNTVQNQLLSGDTSWSNRKVLVERQLSEISESLKANTQLQQVLNQRSRSSINPMEEVLKVLEPHLVLFYELVLNGNESLDPPFNISASTNTPFTDCFEFWLNDLNVSIIDTLDDCMIGGRTDTETVIRAVLAKLFASAGQTVPQLAMPLSTMGPGFAYNMIMSSYQSHKEFLKNSVTRGTKSSTASDSKPKKSTPAQSQPASSPSPSSSSSSSSPAPVSTAPSQSAQSPGGWNQCLSDAEREELERYLSQDAAALQESQPSELSEAYRSGSSALESAGGSNNQSSTGQQTTQRRAPRRPETNQNKADQPLDLD